MKHLQLQRKISQMADKDEDEQLNIIEMLNQKIKDYNEIIDHKHLTPRKDSSLSKDHREDRSKEPRPEADIIADRIKEKAIDLRRHHGSLHSYHHKSKEITELYRQFSKKILDNDSPTPKTLRQSACL